MAIRPPEPTEEDIERVWREQWYTRICNEMGQIDPETIKWILYDYTQLLENTSKVFWHVTSGRISKPNTLASEVIGEHDALCHKDCIEIE